jgi:hypothetical protein
MGFNQSLIRWAVIEILIRTGQVPVVETGKHRDTVILGRNTERGGRKWPSSLHSWLP